MDGTSRIDELEQKFIENPRRFFAPLANEYRKAGNPHQAIAICRAHLGQLPGHMSGQIVYGQALFEGGEYDQARTVFENALAMDRENLVALRHLGDLALRDGETAAARQWYGKVLEIDPSDAAVIALVDGIDATPGTEPQTAADGDQAVAAADVTAPEASSPVAVESADRQVREAEEDDLISEQLGYPVPPPQMFVTETMAELYLAQGFRDRALGVYRELASIRPDDEGVRMRLAELEKAAEPVDRSPPVETPEVRPEAPPDERAPVDSPPPEAPITESDSVEAPGSDAPRADPEDIAATASPLTVRAFFATLGRRRPSSRSNGSGAIGSELAAAPGELSTAGYATDSDTRAAASLAAAFTTPAPTHASSSFAAAAATPAPPPGKESEEDVARFRAWLDGLTGE